MKKSVLAMVMAVLFILMPAAGVLFAQERVLKGTPEGVLKVNTERKPDDATKGKTEVRPEGIQREKPGRRPFGGPDLTVSNIELIKDCWIKVTIKNIGAGGVPEAVYAGDLSAVQMYKGGQPHGGMVLKVFDPSGLLKKPGASVSKVWFEGSPGLDLEPGTHSIKVEVDADNAVAESNENNNSLTRRLNCQESMPDLIVSDIKLIEGTQFAGCLIQVTLKNNGAAGVPDAAYAGSGSTVQMYYGNQANSSLTLQQFDPNGLLKTPGASVSKEWWPAGSGTPTVLGFGIVHPIRVDADANNAVAESSESNNSLTKSLNCPAPNF